MERLLVKYSLWVVIILVHLHAYKCCLERERIGLLELKAFIKSIVVNPDEILTSWVDDKMSDCCGWERIKCNSTTGRVMELSLNSSREVTYYSSSTDGFAILNVSLFHPFEGLLSLNLSYNWFNGWVGNGGSENFLSLKKLKVLNLGYNYFNKSIFPYLSSLTSLKTLILRGNDIEGSLSGQGLANLRNLKNLDLSSNSLNGSLPTQGCESFLSLKKLEVLNLGGNHFNNSIFPYLSLLTSLKTLIFSQNGIEGFLPGQELANLKNLENLDLSFNLLNGPLPTQGTKSFLSLKKLEVLYLGGNSFNNSIFPYLSPLTSLKTLILSGNDIKGSLPGQELANLRNLENLDLSYNRLNGSLPPQGLCEMKNLVELDLSWNEFSGSLPECLRNLTYLRVLDLTGNQLSGNIPSVISNLTSLEYLSLSHNNFGGLFSFSSLANHSKLQVFLLSSQSNKFYVETENFPWLPAFQLKFMQLTNCNLTRTIPRFLLHQYDLRFIDLSHNNLVGMFPTWLLQNNSKLEAMYLMNNSLTGTLQLPTSVQVLHHLQISSNGFDGELPKNIGMILPKLSYMNMSRNSFEGSIPSSIGEMRRLRLLDLSNNNFSGDVPRDLFTDCISLQYLKLSDNSFHGEVIPNYMNLTGLWYLYLSNNSFSGKVGKGLLNSSYLEVLDISNNVLSGEIPHWMGSFSYLRVLVLSKNLLEGSIPVELCSLRYLQFLDLSHNMLSGSVPSSFNLPSLRSLYLQKNGLSGPIPQVLSRSSSLVTLDLRDNKFSGSIPNWINRLPVLSFLLLGGNHLHGHIPNLLCGLRNVWILDLSRNKLYGSIPSCFNNMSFGLTRDDDDAREYEISSSGSYQIDDHLPSYYDDTLGVSRFIGEHGYFFVSGKQIEVEFTTKSRRDSYKGGILMYMAGLDLSCNELTGDIPRQLGDLQGIRALNLSYNSLSGSIPESLSNLTLIESLDLSNNNLSGQIPPQLTELNSLSTFNVSYNNLSGTTPDTGQFGTFIESSYEGNPGLCVSLTKKGCTSLVTPPSTSSEEEVEETVIDLIAFYWSFAGSFVTIQLGLLAVLCINPRWRRAWSHFIEVCIYLCFHRPMKSVYLAMKKCIAI